MLKWRYKAKINTFYMFCFQLLFHINFLFSSQELTETSDEESQPPVIIIQPFKKNGDPLALSKTLKELSPKFVIMYDIDVTAVRRLEVSKSVLLFPLSLIYFLTIRKINCTLAFPYNLVGMEIN